MSEFHADVAAAQNHQMLGQIAEFHDRDVVEEGHEVESIEFGDAGPGSGVDENTFGRHRALAAVIHANQNRLGGSEAGFSEDEFEVGGLLDARLVSVAEAIHDIALALANFFQVNRDRAGVDSVIGGPAGKVSDASAGDHCLGGSASFVYASAADVLAFDECGAEAGVGQRHGERCPALSGADDDCVVLLVHECCPSANLSDYLGAHQDVMRCLKSGNQK